MGYKANQIITGSVTKIKDHRVYILLPNGERAIIDAKKFCHSKLSLKNRTKVGDCLPFVVQGYDEELNKPILNHALLLEGFDEGLTRIVAWTARGKRGKKNYDSDTFYATVTDENSQFYFAEIFPNLIARINKDGFILDRFDRVLLSVKHIHFNAQVVDCIVEHIPYEKNFMLNNFKYKPFNRLMCDSNVAA